MTLISWYSFVRPSRRRLTQDEARRTTFATGLLGPKGLAFGPNGTSTSLITSTEWTR